MDLIIISFVAGVLTVLAPCVLPILPIIIGGAVADKNPMRPIIITGALGFSVVCFTLLLKASTFLIDVPADVWKYISGGIVIIFGSTMLFPEVWEYVSIKLKLSQSSDKLLETSAQKKGFWGSVLVGMALGPVFSSCSPTYSLILATVLPRSFALGIINLIAYALGLAAIMLLIAVFGQKLIARLRWFANPRGWFKRGLGVLFLLVGISVITGFDKKIETYLLDQGLFDVTKIESSILDDMKN